MILNFLLASTTSSVCSLTYDDDSKIKLFIPLGILGPIWFVLKLYSFSVLIFYTHFCFHLFYLFIYFRLVSFSALSSPSLFFNDNHQQIEREYVFFDVTSQ